MTILEQAKIVHQNAVEHGWWDDKREHDEIMALVISELAEIMEAFRAGDENKQCDKDIGLTCLEEETADVYLRILDYIGYLGYSSIIKYHAPEIRKRIQFLFKNRSEGSRIGALIKSIVLNFSTGTGYDYLLAMLEEYAVIQGVDLQNAVTVKHAYNKTRPFKHGGKKF